MRTRRSAITGLCLVIALSFGVAGCNNATDGGGADTTAPASASQVNALDSFAGAIQKLDEETFKVSRKTGRTVWRSAGSWIRPPRRCP